MSVLSAAHFHDETAAFAELESLIWPHGPVCPHCGGKERIYKLQGVRTKPSKKNPEGVERPGLKKCGHCRKQFTVRVGTVFESSHIPLHKWFQAVHLMCSSKKGISSHQLHRTLEINYEAAWFMSHRIREAMRSGGLGPMGGGGNIVEIDETYISHKGKTKIKRGGPHHKRAVLTLVSREGEARSFHVENANRENIMPIIRANLAAEAKVITDDSGIYRNLDKEFLHAFVNHSAYEWGRGEIHTNTIEGFYSIFKRGMKGVYQHCSEKHLHRYLAEFDFRYSNRKALGIEDKDRAINAMKGAKGKRLTYRQPNSEQGAT
ncbi:MAG: IS1595 family transposase [Hyphomicrobium sp.]